MRTPTNDREALKLALTLSITAPAGEEAKMQQCIQWAQQLAVKLGEDVTEAVKAEILNDVYWTYWASPDTDWDSHDVDQPSRHSYPCPPSIMDIINEAERRGWTGDNGWESSDDLEDDDRVNCELADANEEAAMEYIWADIQKKGAG